MIPSRWYIDWPRPKSRYLGDRDINTFIKTRKKE